MTMPTPTPNPIGLASFNICHIASIKHGWTSYAPGPHSWAAWLDIAGPGAGVRLGVPLAKAATRPDPSGPYIFDDWAPEWNRGMLNDTILGIVAAGLAVDLNPGGAPAIASEGQPAYIGTIEGFPPNTPDHFGGSAWYNTDPHDGGLIHFFDQNAETNPQFAAIDKLQPPRPYLTAAGMPHIDLHLYLDAGRYLAGPQGPNGVRWPIRSFAAWNEPGGDLYWPPARYDRFTYGSKGELGDTIRGRFFREVVNPFNLGVLLAANPNALISGCHADSADILGRYLGCDVYTDRFLVHPYGDVNSADYATMKAFRAVLKDRLADDKEWGVGEITADPETLYKWTADFMRDPANATCREITYNDPSVWFESGTWEIPNTATPAQIGGWHPVPNQWGLRLKALIAANR